MYFFIVWLLLLQATFPWSLETSFTPSGNDKIYCLDISPDGTKLVVGGEAQKVVIY